MNKIQQLYKEWHSLQPLNDKLERNINQQFMVDFNYNSNHLEGNTLTYGQTKLLLLFGDTIGNASIQDYEEMKAHNVGFELMKIEATACKLYFCHFGKQTYGTYSTCQR